MGDYANNPTLGFEDTLDGGAGDDQMQGGGGNDLLDGGSENDPPVGDDGDDSLYGGIGDDQLQGGAGDDVLVGEEGADVLFGQAGDDLLFGDDGNDQLSGGVGFDQLAGGAGNDVLFGNDGADELFGDEGNDELQGGGDYDLLVGDVGNDRLFGDAGADALSGDEGTDLLEGGAGNDVLDGGFGSDTYVFDVGDGQDVISEQDSLADVNTIQFVSPPILPVYQGPPLEITLNMLTFTPDEAEHTLLIQVGTGGDSILVNGFSNTASTARVEYRILCSEGSAIRSPTFSDYRVETLRGQAATTSFGLETATIRFKRVTAAILWLPTVGTTSSSVVMAMT